MRYVSEIFTVSYVLVIACLVAGVMPILLVLRSGGLTVTGAGLTYLLGDYVILTLARISMIGLGIISFYTIYRRPNTALTLMPLIMILTFSLTIL
jgi:hypothetical protein